MSQFAYQRALILWMFERVENVIKGIEKRILWMTVYFCWRAFCALKMFTHGPLQLKAETNAYTGGALLKYLSMQIYFLYKRDRVRLSQLATQRADVQSIKITKTKVCVVCVYFSHLAAFKLWPRPKKNFFLR